MEELTGIERHWQAEDIRLRDEQSRAKLERAAYLRAKLGKEFDELKLLESELNNQNQFAAMMQAQLGQPPMGSLGGLIGFPGIGAYGSVWPGRLM